MTSDPTRAADEQTTATPDADSTDADSTDAAARRRGRIVVAVLLGLVGLGAAALVRPREPLQLVEPVELPALTSADSVKLEGRLSRSGEIRLGESIIVADRDGRFGESIALEEGRRTLQLTRMDGTPLGPELTIQRDATPPALTLTGLRAGVWVAGEDGRLRGRVEDASPVTLVESDAEFKLDADGRFELPLTDASRPMNLQLRDAAGNTTERSVVAVTVAGFQARMDDLLVTVAGDHEGWERSGDEDRLAVCEDIARRFDGRVVFERLRRIPGPTGLAVVAIFRHVASELELVLVPGGRRDIPPARRRPTLPRRLAEGALDADALAAALAALDAKGRARFVERLGAKVCGDPATLGARVAADPKLFQALVEAARVSDAAAKDADSAETIVSVRGPVLYQRSEMSRAAWARLSKAEAPKSDGSRPQGVPDPPALLTALRELEFRLPTSGEWRMAVDPSGRRPFVWGSKPEGGTRFAWTSETIGADGPKPVDAHRGLPCGFGQWDMHGNVAELCADRMPDDTVVLRWLGGDGGLPRVLADEAFEWPLAGRPERWRGFRLVLDIPGRPIPDDAARPR